jgi:hypothetical protein
MPSTAQILRFMGFLRLKYESYTICTANSLYSDFKKIHLANLIFVFLLFDEIARY